MLGTNTLGEIGLGEVKAEAGGGAAVEINVPVASITLAGSAPTISSGVESGVSGRVGTSYAYKTLSQIKREKNAELARIKKAATERVEAALDHVDPQEASRGLLSLVKQEVTATVPESMTWLTPAMLDGIVNSIMLFQRAQIRRALIRRQEEEDEADVEILLLAA